MGADAIKKMLNDEKMDWCVLHHAGAWHAMVTPPGQMMAARGYETAKTEAAALRKALGAARKAART